jgi:hypothetical protein
MHLPQTLANLTQPNLAQILNAEVPAAAIPLEAFLQRGGWPEAPQLLLRGVKETESTAQILLTVQFIEQCPASCPSNARPELRQGYLVLHVEKATGKAKFTVDS